MMEVQHMLAHHPPYSQRKRPRAWHRVPVAWKAVLIELGTWAIGRGKGWVVHQVHAAIAPEGPGDA
jgi:hypothetical protein